MLSGRVVKVKTRIGDRVSVGDVLAEVQSDEIETMQLALQTTQVELTLAERVVQSLEQAAGAVPERDRTAAAMQLQQAKNAYDLARLKWQALNLPEEYLNTTNPPQTQARLPIRALRGGTVTSSTAAVGQFVQPGVPLFEIIDLSTVWAKIGVLELDMYRVNVGQEVAIQLTAYPDTAFAGRVSFISQSLGPVTHLNDVWVELHNTTPETPQLLPGLRGQADLRLPQSVNAVHVPMAALVNNGVEQFVFREEGTTTELSEYRKVNVEVVHDSNRGAVVRAAGLFPGDRVVTRGSHELAEFFEPEALQLSPEALRTHGITVRPVAYHSVQHVVEVPAVVIVPPEQQSVAVARFSGQVSAITCQPMQNVEANTLLAELQSIELLNAQLDYLREHLATELAEQQWHKLKASQDAIPQQRLAEAEAQATLAANKRDSARRHLMLSGLTDDQLAQLIDRREIVKSLPVVAPSPGRVMSLSCTLGQTVETNAPLVTFHQVKQPLLEGLISEAQLASIKLGQSTRVQCVGLPGVTLTGRVVRSGQNFGTPSRTLSVWVELDAEPTVELRHQQLATLNIITADAPSSVAVPHSAIVHEGQRAYVFVQSAPNQFQRREVHLGNSDDRYTEIRHGLTIGEAIAMTGATALQTALASIH
jgi:RND family efflux transporter MFP subunit